MIAAEVREAVDADMAAVQAIYAHHVMNGCGTFEEVAPDLTEMERRRAGILHRRLPYLVAERNGEVLGFAYAAQFRPRSAYRLTVEDSIYVAPQAMGRGVGRMLLKHLVRLCTDLGYRQMVAAIGDSENVVSVALHASQGFVDVGCLKSAGFKLGRWVDMVLMQRPLGDGGGSPPRN